MSQSVPAVSWSAFESTNAIGDPGRQPEIAPTIGALGVGVPDTALDFLTVGPFELRACSSRGWSHRYQGTPRQDSFCLLVNDDVIVVAVADGVSEGEYSQVAAETAARSACKLAADQLGRNGCIDWGRLARRVSLRIIEESEYRKISAPPPQPDPTPEDRLRACLAVMASTLILAVIGRQPGLDGFKVEIGVVSGDSEAFLLRGGSLRPIGGGKDTTESIASTQVRPLPGPVTPECGSFALRPGEALFLGTDGVGDPVGDGTGEMGQELAVRWAQPPTIDKFLLDVNSYRRSYDDDRTAVGIWVRPDFQLPLPSVLDAAPSSPDLLCEPMPPVAPPEEVPPVSELEPATLAADQDFPPEITRCQDQAVALVTGGEPDAQTVLEATPPLPLQVRAEGQSPAGGESGV